MKPIILIAPPQAGKGTLSKSLVAKYNIPHISTGDLLREEVASGSDWGKELDEKMKNGVLIDDDTMIKLVLNRISKDDAANGYILDGFPRTVNQIKAFKEALDKENKELGNVFILEIPFELALERVSGRVVCPKCGASYSTHSDSKVRAKVDGICDLCGEALVVRSDDNEESLRKRFDVYKEQTEPIIEYLEPMGIVFHVDSSEKDSTLAEVTRILESN